ncbi:NAD(P)/FAD-dependent oxidoreductase [Photobacterium sp.]|uniref:NAD(P)/FAD-dependent oxidoreductase n=1 Tax=Photobacterium sp. TaxID=660 RepID=UPI00299DB174|nr:FAD-dependent oxidoreductase [Photobacterium sp.]MDX1301441.1 FAD-dependent oxidoreductase [Photobacterium sp.]
MKIAIIGSGISGLSCAWYLHQQHDIKVFEANDYIGGHTATVDVSVPSGRYAIDTGFIVFNNRTYPNFERLLAEIGIEGQPTEMSFSVCNQVNGLEYNGHSFSSLFAQKRNLLNPRFYYFLYEVLRFNRLAKSAANSDTLRTGTLGDFLSRHGFGEYFSENYILPMGAAIWSSSLFDMRGFPLEFFLRFFLNHGLLDIADRPQWSVIPGGSREYVRKITPAFADSIALNTPVVGVTRRDGIVEIETEHGVECFDQVIFACHSDQALAMLKDATTDEKRALGAIEYQDNEVVLHTDPRVLPEARAAWASWNYRLEPDKQTGRSQEHMLATLTYNMNILQGLDAPETFCVTLNQSEKIDPDKILRRFVYAHPVFSTQSIIAQQSRSDINGKQGCWFCGAYWYNGFHEDGVRSALDVVAGINASEESVFTSSSRNTTNEDLVGASLNSRAGL